MQKVTHNTMIKLAAGASALSMLLVATPVLGAEANGGVPQAARAALMGRSASTTEQAREGRQEFRDDIKNIHASTTQERRDIQGDFRENLSEHRAAKATASTTHQYILQMVKERNEALKELRSSAKLQIANAFSVRVSNRFEVAVERFTGIADRLGSRIEKIKATGATTTDAETNLSAARTHIAAASTAAKAFATALVNANASTTPVTLQTAAKTASETIKTELETAEQYLKDALKSLKGLEVRGNATSTASTTPHN